MGKYTTITVRKKVVTELDTIRKELKTKSLNDTIVELIRFYRRIKVKKFVEEVKNKRDRSR